MVDATRGFNAADSAAATGDEVLVLPVVVGVVTGLGLGCIVCAMWVVIPCPLAGCSPVVAGALDAASICATRSRWSGSPGLENTLNPSELRPIKIVPSGCNRPIQWSSSHFRFRGSCCMSKG